MSDQTANPAASISMSQLATELGATEGQLSELLWTLGVMPSGANQLLDPKIVSVVRFTWAPPAPEPKAQPKPKPMTAPSPRVHRRQTLPQRGALEDADAPEEEDDIELTGNLAPRVFEWSQAGGIETELVLEILGTLGVRCDHLSKLDTAIMDRVSQEIAKRPTARIEETLKSGLRKRRRFKQPE
ncbi:MAG: hypothetical protein ACI9OJ_002693 [Myxococcota bacterium]|jgi:hypothetical protein